MGSAGAATAAVSSEVLDLLGIVLEVAPRLGDGVPSKFLQKSIGEHKGYHCFASYSGGRHDAPVRALISCLHGLLRDHVRGAESAPQRRNRFQIAAHNHVFAIGDAAFESTSAIRRAAKFLRSLVV